MVKGQYDFRGDRVLYFTRSEFDRLLGVRRIFYPTTVFFSADLPAMDMADFKMMSATSAL